MRLQYEVLRQQAARSDRMAKASRSPGRGKAKGPRAAKKRPSAGRDEPGRTGALMPTALVETMQQRLVGARDQASETWDNLELLFQTRVQRALQQLGIPSGDEIRLLARRVAELNDSVQELLQSSARLPAEARSGRKKKSAAGSAKRQTGRSTAGKGRRRRAG